jgi:hypothetical protein
MICADRLRFVANTTTKRSEESDHFSIMCAARSDTRGRETREPVDGCHL